MTLRLLAAPTGPRMMNPLADPDDLAAVLEEVRAQIVASGFFAYAGPDELMKTLIDALELPDQVIIIETRLESEDETKAMPRIAA